MSNRQLSQIESTQSHTLRGTCGAEAGGRAGWVCELDAREPEPAMRRGLPAWPQKAALTASRGAAQPQGGAAAARPAKVSVPAPAPSTLAPHL